jgi:hypothetical protein
MRLIASLAVLLALATPANARFYTFWRCGEVTVELVDNQERKAMRGLPGKHPDTWSITFEGLRHTTLDRRGLNFKSTADGFSLNGRRCETMPMRNGKSCTPLKSETDAGYFGRLPTMPYAHMFEQNDSNSAAAINAALKGRGLPRLGAEAAD